MPVNFSMFLNVIFFFFLKPQHHDSNDFQNNELRFFRTKKKKFTSFQMKSVAFEDGVDMWLALGTAES